MRPTIHSEEQKRLGALLVDARHRAGLTQTQVAAKIEEHQSFVAKYENGELRLDVIEFIEICSVLGVDPAALSRSWRSRSPLDAPPGRLSVAAQLSN